MLQNGFIPHRSPKMATIKIFLDYSHQIQLIFLIYILSLPAPWPSLTNFVRIFKETIFSSFSSFFTLLWLAFSSLVIFKDTTSALQLFVISCTDLIQCHGLDYGENFKWEFRYHLLVASLHKVVDTATLPSHGWNPEMPWILTTDTLLKLRFTQLSM